MCIFPHNTPRAQGDDFAAGGLFDRGNAPFELGPIGPPVHDLPASDIPLNFPRGAIDRVSFAGPGAAFSIRDYADVAGEIDELPERDITSAGEWLKERLADAVDREVRKILTADLASEARNPTIITFTEDRGGFIEIESVFVAIPRGYER